MKRRLLILAAVTAAEAAAIAVCSVLVDRQIDRIAGEIDDQYPTPLPRGHQTRAQR